MSSFPPPDSTDPPGWHADRQAGQARPEGYWTVTGPPPRDPYGPPESPREPGLPRPNYLLHGGLFVATIATTILVGGPYYGVAIILILLAHEMGHYLVARRYRVPASLPYFIPMPLSLFGTFGAVIRMASLGADRRILFDIAVAGPIAGLVLALPACIVGLSMSHVVTTATLEPGQINLGSSILFQWFSDLQFGKLPPGQDIQLHPLAFAGWAGLFVTALNLLPVGQLDGGHVVYALLGRKAHLVSIAFAVGFALLAVFVNHSWGIMAVLLLFFGLRHPPTADDSVPIDTRRKLIGLALMILFVLTFTPNPVQL